MATEERSNKLVESAAGKNVAVIGDNPGGVHFHNAPDSIPPIVPMQVPPRNLPPRDEKFVGRKAELKQIHKLLSADAEVGVTQQAGTHGYGGVGKSSVAVEYAWEHLEHYRGGAFFIRCETDLLLPQIAGLAQHLGLPESEKPEQTAARVKAMLEAGQPALLILDNVPGQQQWLDPEWSRYVPGGNCRRLITTREPHLPGLKMIPIERLPRDKGIELLAEYRKDAKHADHKPLVGNIVDWFDGWAVGLVVVGIYMANQPQLSWERYAQSLDKKGLGTVKDTLQAVGGVPNYERRVDQVFGDLFQSLPQPERRALEYSALLPPDQVLRSWLNWLLTSHPKLKLPSLPGFEHEPSAAVLSNLEQRGLLRPLAESDGVLTLHRVLRESVRERLQAEHALIQNLLDRIVALMQAGGAVSRTLLRPELVSLFALSEELRLHDRQERGLSLAYENLGEASLRRGDLGGATRYFQQALKLNEAAAADPTNVEAQRDLSVSYEKLGTVSLQAGQVKEALAYYQKSLNISHKLAAADPSDVQAQRDLSVSYEKLGNVSLQAGQMTEALVYYQKDLEISHKLAAAYPTDAQVQRDLFVSYEKLGTVSLEAAQVTEALVYYQKGLDISHKLAAANPTDAQAQRDLWVSYNKLGTVSLQAGQVTEALAYCQKGLEISQKFAAADPMDAQAQRDLWVSYLKLGDVSLEAGQATEALVYYQKGLDISQKLAAADPMDARAQFDMFPSHYNIAAVHVRQQQYEQAIEWYRSGLNVLQSLKEQNRITPAQDKWIGIVEEAIAECRRLKEVKRN